MAISIRSMNKNVNTSLTAVHGSLPSEP